MNTTKLRKDLEQLIMDYGRLENENKHLKTLLYRMVATHGNRVEPVGYLPRKTAKICEIKVQNTNSSIIFSSRGVGVHIPNNSEAEV